MPNNLLPFRRGNSKLIKLILRLLYKIESFTDDIRNEPQLPIEDAKVDVRLSVIKPLHAKTMAKAFTFFSSTEGKKIIASGWRGAGIAETIERARSISPIVGLVDPFQDLTL